MLNIIEGKYCIFNYSELPHFENRALQLFKYFETKCPEILQLVNLPSREKINIFIKILPQGYPACKTGHSDIYFDPNQIHPGDLGFLVHEGTHVVQDFQDSAFEDLNNRWWIVEGMANYVRMLLGWDGPYPYKFEPENKIKSNLSLKDQGDYDVWAEFFKWLSEKYSKGKLLADFTNALRNGEKDEDFLITIFGKRSNQLWKEFLTKE